MSKVQKKKKTKNKLKKNKNKKTAEQILFKFILQLCDIDTLQ